MLVMSLLNKTTDVVLKKLALNLSWHLTELSEECPGSSECLNLVGLDLFSGQRSLI